MKLFKMVNWVLQVEESAWALKPFKKILDRDKSKSKEQALKDMLFIYYYSDIRSDYNYITDDDDRLTEIKNDLALPKTWKIDAVMKEAIDLYEERSTTMIGKLYRAASKSANDVADHLSRTNVLLSERDDKGKPVHTINSITSALKQVPGIMKDLKTSEKELLKEMEDKEGRSKGARTFGLFEDGLQ